MNADERNKLISKTKQEIKQLDDLLSKQLVDQLRNLPKNRLRNARSQTENILKLIDLVMNADDMNWRIDRELKPGRPSSAIAKPKHADDCPLSDVEEEILKIVQSVQSNKGINTTGVRNELGWQTKDSGGGKTRDILVKLEKEEKIRSEKLGRNRCWWIIK